MAETTRISDIGERRSMFAVFGNFLARSGWAQRMGVTFGGQRDVYQVLGYKRDLGYDDLYGRYKRGGIAKRIVNAPAQATWRKQPKVKEKRRAGQSSDNQTAFEKAWETLVDRHKLFTALERLDKQAGVGRYAGLFLGLPGHPSGELTEGYVAKGVDSLLYLSPLAEPALDIERFVSDPNNPEFGRVEMYKLTHKRTVRDARNVANATITPFQAHASRVIHVAEDTYDDDVFGSGRLEHIYNYLEDIEKVVGGAAELFWRAAWGGIHADLRDGHTMGQEDEAALADEIEKYVHQMERVLKTKGIDINQLGGTMIDPSNAARTIIDLLAGATGIPQRILVGSERGELSSTQDESNWNNRVSERQISFAQPCILEPLIDRLIFAGVLPKPRLGYEIEWSDLTVLTPADRGEFAGRMGQALQRFEDARAKAGGDTIVTPEEFRRDVLDLPAQMPTSTVPSSKGKTGADPAPPDDGDDDVTGDV